MELIVNVKEELDKKAEENYQEVQSLLEKSEKLLQSTQKDEKSLVEELDIEGSFNPQEQMIIDLYKDYGKLVTYKDLIEIGMKYNMRCLGRNRFKDKLPVESLDSILRFKYELERKDKKFHKENLYVLAPAQSFTLHKANKDPLLLYKVHEGYFKVLYKWGDDFTIARKLQAFFMRNNIFFGLLFAIIMLLSIITPPILFTYWVKDFNGINMLINFIVTGALTIPSFAVFNDMMEEINPDSLDESIVFKGEKIWDFSEYYRAASLHSVVWLLSLVCIQVIYLINT